MAKPREDSPVLFAIMSATIGFFGCVGVLLIYFFTVSCDSEYAIVFDLGSYHTQMTLFKWPQVAPNATEEMTEVHTLNCKGGSVLSHTKNSKKIQDLISKCLEGARKHIKLDAAKTPILAGGSAGFELLRLTNETLLNETVQSLISAFSSSGFLFKSSYFKVLTGVEEAMFGWVAGNYMLKTLFKPNRETVAMLDWGGDSSSVAVAASNRSINASLFIVLGHERKIDAFSFLCLGIDQLYLRHLSWMIQDPLSTGFQRIDDPCAPPVTVMNKTIEELFLGPCTFRKQFVADRERLVSKKENCEKQLQLLLDPDACQRDFVLEKCPASLNVQSKHFYAFSLYHAIAAMYKYSVDKHWKDMQGEIEDVCHLSWDELFNRYHDKLDDDILFILCFESLFMMRFFDSSLNLVSDSSVYFVDEVNGMHVSWSLGYLMHTLANKSIEVSPPIPIPMAISLSILFFVFFAASIAYIIWERQKKQKEKCNAVSCIPVETTFMIPNPVSSVSKAAYGGCVPAPEGQAKLDARDLKRQQRQQRPSNPDSTKGSVDAGGADRLEESKEGNNKVPK